MMKEIHPGSIGKSENSYMKKIKNIRSALIINQTFYFCKTLIICRTLICKTLMICRTLIICRLKERPLLTFRHRTVSPESRKNWKVRA